MIWRYSIWLRSWITVLIDPFLWLKRVLGGRAIWVLKTRLEIFPCWLITTGYLCNSARYLKKPMLQILDDNIPRQRRSISSHFPMLPCFVDLSLLNEKNSLPFELRVDRISLPKQDMLSVRPARPQNPKCQRHCQLWSVVRLYSWWQTRQTSSGILEMRSMTCWD